jgi:glycosidase
MSDAGPTKVEFDPTFTGMDYVRELLHAAAEKDHRSMANMVEMLILKHCEANSISMVPKRKASKGRT